MENHPISIIKHKQRVRTMVASMMKPVLGFQEEVRISMVNLVRQWNIPTMGTCIQVKGASIKS
jgi:hypothetical protein